MLNLQHEDTCFIFVDEDGSTTRFSLRQAHMRVRQLVSHLEPLLAEEGSVALVDLPNGPLFVWALLACAHLGKPLVALNHRLTASEKRLRIEQLEPHAAIGAKIDESWVRLLERLPADEGEPGPSGWRPLDEMRAPDPDSCALVMFTSGTSGIPKAAKLTWRQLLASAQAANRSLNCGQDAFWQAALPLCHIGGLQVAVRSFLAGIPFALYRRWDACRVLEDARRFGATHLSVVDKMLQDLVAADASRPAGASGALGDYQCILLGGAALNEQTLAKARGARARVFASYGMTETASQVANCLVDDSFAGGLQLVADVEARILDPDGAGRGILALRGPSVFAGYLNAPAPFTSDGFFITGDTARLDAGALFVYERADDLFVSGGENVYPAEVERCIRQVAGVTDCYVFGMPDDAWGMRPAALVETALDPAVAEQLVHEHVCAHLTRFSRPDRIVAVAEIPRSGIGKIDRAAARALAT